MSWRYVPPVYSPLSATALIAGFRAALRGGDEPGERLARSLAQFHGVTRVVLTDSGTTALRLAMTAAMEASGRGHIALPAWCCYDVVTALNGAGAGAVLYDVDPETLGPVWSSLEDALQTRPAAVVAVHLYGLPVDMPRVMELAEHQNVPVIEDSAQGIGGALGGRPLGSFGHLRILSFGRGKGVTGGHGGALMAAPGWRGPIPTPPARPARGVGTLAGLTGQWLLGRPGVYRVPASIPGLGLGETVYRTPSPSAGLSAAAAAVIEHNWRTRHVELDRRRQCALRLGRALESVSALRPIRPIEGASPGWLRFPVLAVDPNGARRSLEGLRSAGVMPGYPRLLSDLPEFPVPVRPLACPLAARLPAALWTLPTHRFVRDTDLEDLRRRLAAVTQ